MADMITRCPKCSTAFRISEELIQSAKGIVRCGSCLNVFNAKEYLVGNTAKKQQADSTATSRPMRQVIDDLEQLAKTTQSVHRSATHPAPGAHTPNSKLKKPQAFAPTQQQKLKKPGTENTSLFERKPEFSTEDESDDETGVDEAWALELLKEESEDDTQTTVTPPAAPSSKQKALNASTPLTAIEAEKTTVIASHPDAATPHSNKYAQPQKPQTQASEPTTQASSAPTTEANETESNKTEAASGQTGPNFETEASRQDGRQDSALINTIAFIEPESLDSILKERQSSLSSRIIWSTLCFFALIALAGQILWLQFYRFNQEEPYRSIYSIACAVLECELPELLDRSKIQTSKLIIRSHPSENKALIVDVIIKNTAQFEQRFPSLRLTFTDLKNNTVAARKFKPTEYLGGELTGQTMMPTDQSIHIGMEIVDPGALAVSYSITVED